MMMIHEARKPSLATNSNSFVIVHIDHLQPILETQGLTHEYHQPCDLLYLL